MQQVIQTCRLCNLDDDRIVPILEAVGANLNCVSLNEAPPVMATQLQKIVTTMLGTSDPLKQVKRESNAAATLYRDAALNIVAESDDRLRAAIQVAIAGNIIDYGAIHDLNVEAELSRIMAQEQVSLSHQQSRLFAYQELREALANSGTLLYIGDNAGEIIFDRILIQTIRDLYPELQITFAVRGEPIFNDILVEDAVWAGIDTLAEVISSGVNSPGLILDYATEEFREVFHASDLIISKGQGNLEGLYDAPGPIYFLLVAKCEPIARMLGCSVRDILLIQQTLMRNHL